MEGRALTPDLILLRFYTCAHLQEAQLLVQLLDGKRIDATIVNSNASSGLGDLPVTLPEIWLLDERDMKLARNVITDYEALAKQADHNQLCQQCDEPNPGNFELCWNCGTGFD